MPGSREEDFLKKYIHFTLFTPKLSPFGKHEIYNFLSPYPTYATVKIGQERLKEKMINDGCKPIAKAYLSDSDDIISKEWDFR